MKRRARNWFGSLYGRLLWIWPILLLGVWVRLPGMSEGRSLWMDEILSLRGARGGVGYLPELYQNTYGATSLSTLTSYLIFKVSDWTLPWGNLWAARLPHLALGLATIWMGWTLGRIWRRWLTGLILALLLCLWPFKVYWDTVIRFYAGILFFSMALIVAWEAYRRRPDRRRLTIALAVTLLAPLNSMQSFPLIVVGWVYLGWMMAMAVWRWKRSRVKGKTEIDRQGLKRWAMRAGALAAVTLGVVMMSRGAAWTLDQALNMGRRITFQQIVEKKEGAAARVAAPAERLADIVSIDRATGEKRADLPALRPGDFIRFIRNGVKEAFQPGRWSAAPLLGLGGKLDLYTECTTFYPLQAPRAGEAFNIVLLISIAAGAAALLRISPPLLVTLGVLIVAIGTALERVGLTQYTSSRYFAIPSLSLLILSGVGLAAMLNGIAWAARKAWPRRMRGVTLCMGAGFGLALIGTLWSDARRGAAYEAHKYQEFYQEMRGRYPHGALFNPLNNAPYYAFFQDLALFREARPEGKTGYWTSARRNAFVTAKAGGADPALTGLALGEKAMDKEAVVIFSADGSGPPREIGGAISDCLPPPRRFAIRPAEALVYELGQRMFVTRGNASTPLLPRFDEAPTTGSAGRCAMTCFYEIPGSYEVRLPQPPDNPLLRAWVDGAEVKVQGVATSETARAADWTRRLARDQYSSELKDARIVKENTPAPVIESGGRVSFMVNAPPAPLSPQRIVLEFKKPLGERRPLLEWRLRPSQAAPIAPEVELGDLRLWDRQGILNIAPALRATGGRGKGNTIRLTLIDAATGGSLRQTTAPLGADPTQGRELEPGDWQMPPPLAIDIELVKRTLGRVLCVGLSPGVDWTPPADAGGAYRTVEAAGARYIALVYIRYGVANNRVRIQMERTPEAFGMAAGGVNPIP